MESINNMDFTINSQTKEFLTKLDVTPELKELIFKQIENAYYRGHTDGYLDGYNRGYEEGHWGGFYEEFC